MRLLTAAGGAALAVVALAIAGSATLATSSAAPDAARTSATIADYLNENGITQTPVHRGDPGTPALDLPMPAGWVDGGAQTPASAWSEMVELENLPDFQGTGEVQADELGGFEAFQFGGTYVKDGASTMIAHKTVAIPARDGSGLFVLQLIASGSEEHLTRWWPPPHRSTKGR